MFYINPNRVIRTLMWIWSLEIPSYGFHKGKHMNGHTMTSVILKENEKQILLNIYVCWQPSCSLLYTSLPAPITTKEWGTEWTVPAHQWTADSPPWCISHLGWGFQPRRDLKSVFSKTYQHIDFPTRGNNILDFVYTTPRGAFPLPHLGASDQITVMLMHAYRPLVKVAKPVRKQILVWAEGSSEALLDCFSTTDWNMFKQAATYNNTTDLQEYTETVTAYITKCIDDVTVTKTIKVRANQKPWLTEEVPTDSWRLVMLPSELEMW